MSSSHTATGSSQASAPEVFCREVLPLVSRTFALNIPVLPEPLDLVVTVAYLLCRIADTLEDESTQPVAVRGQLFAQLGELVELPSGWETTSKQFVRGAVATLREAAPPSEVQLVEGTGQVLSALAGLPEWTRPHIARCVQAMCAGMSKVSAMLEKTPGAIGLPNLEATLEYCYYVAGTVGEMLTGLFGDFDPAVRAKLEVLNPRASAFGRALQLTNILKDVREDLDRGSCWLPIDRMQAHGLTAKTLAEPAHRTQAVALLDELLGVARTECARALEYTLAVPPEQTGLRTFCLWPLLGAVLTLSKLQGNPAVFDPAPVKISRSTLQWMMVTAQQHVSDDEKLRALYAQCLAGGVAEGQVDA